MSAQTWASLRATLLAALVKAQPPYTAAVPDFDVLFPQATNYAEGRICRDIVFLNQRAQNSTLITSAGKRTLSLSSMNIAGGAGPMVVVEGLSLITPSGSNPTTGTRVPFDAASLDVIDQIWPVESTTLAPNITGFARYWAMRDDATIVYAPTADAAYTAEITGLFQPAALASTNQSTYISTVYPDLLEAACMVFLTGALLHNFGSQSDDPKSAMSWEATYHTLMMSARNEEARRRGLAPDRAAPGAAA